MPDTELLTDQQIAEIEARATAATKGPWLQSSLAGMYIVAQSPIYQIVAAVGEYNVDGSIHLEFDNAPANLDFVLHARADIPALIATVKQLRRSERAALDRGGKYCDRPDDMPVNAVVNVAFNVLESQLEQLRAENQQLKLIVDVGTNDDPGTALAKLRKIQHVATTSMRDKCVDAIKSLRATPHGAAYNNAVNDAIRKCESLTLDPLEPEKQ